ncbi:membrane protein [Streptomyces aurantiacus]|uniref:Membrane protein n=2 Tax=Streptomyces aurantiacus TaxID=47760 RepID=A0A7G1NSL0_9ACTN|nr:membrane protein [Streptomyces aurantiacus]
MMDTSTLTRGSRAGRRKAAPTIEGAARAGLTARGVIYLLVGMLALQIAFGGSGKQADQGGALQEVAGKPFGAVVLWALGVGLTGMALWRLSEAVFGAAGPDGRKGKKRLASAARAVFYGFVAYSVLSFAAGSGGSGSSDGKSRDVTAEAMDLPAGQWLVGVAGVVILCAGVWMVVQAARRTYRKHLRLGGTSHRVRRTIDVTGVAGGVARGLVFAVAGGFAVRAAWDYEADKAKGMDDTLRSFTETPVGPWLLVFIAVGLMLFGVFSFAMARWRRV